MIFYEGNLKKKPMGHYIDRVNLERLNHLSLITLTLLISPAAFALNLQGYHFSDSYRYSLLDDSLMEKFDGRYVVTASYGNVQSPFYYSDSNLNDLKERIIDYNQVLNAGFSYYLNKNVFFGIDVNAINNKVFGENYITMGNSPLMVVRVSQVWTARNLIAWFNIFMKLTQKRANMVKGWPELTLYLFWDMMTFDLFI